MDCTSTPGHYVNADNQCVSCSSGTYYFNNSCISSCPEGYTTISTGCTRCSSNLFYYNQTCLSSCPATTYIGLHPLSGEKACLPCSVGCETCSDGTSTECVTCSTGFFYLDNSCNSGCPTTMYADSETRACTQCDASCATCNKTGCTSCPRGNFLLNGTCVESCPVNYYQSYGGEGELYQVPICEEKLVLTFNLSLTINAHVVYINFNYGISSMILSMSQKIVVQMANAQVDSSLYVLNPVSESRIKFAYTGEQYYPPLSLLNITINLNNADFDGNSYQKFRMADKTASIQLKEIYPFSRTEEQFISSSSLITVAGGGAVAALQVVASVAQGGRSMGLIRLQIVGELVQLMRFVAIRWPANVVEYFGSTRIDPSSIVLPINFAGALNSNLSNRNYSMPRIYEEYEISPFFTVNYEDKLSNLALYVPILLGGSFLLNVLAKALELIAGNAEPPKKNELKKKKKCNDILHSISRFLGQVDTTLLWSFLLIFILSIYQSGCFWSLLNMRYASSLLEPTSSATWSSMALGVVFFLFFLILFGLVSGLLLDNMKYLLCSEGAEDHPRLSRLNRYKMLYSDYHRKNKMQILFTPILLLRSLLFVAVIVLMGFSPITQITLLWIIDTAFVLYLVVYQPLKERWIKIAKLIIEFLAYGCITLAFIIGIIDQSSNVDATTINGLGYAFIALCIGSTFAGVILSVVQVMLLIKMLYRYVSKARAKKNQVQPISREDLQTVAVYPTPTAESKAFFDDKLIIETSLSRLDRHPSSVPKTREFSEDEKMYAFIKKLSPSIFEKGPQERQLLKGLKDWWNSARLVLNKETNDVTPESGSQGNSL